MPGNTPVTATQFAKDYSALIGHVWFFLGGGMIALMMSIFDQTRRTALRLLVGCIFGGLGGVVAGLLLENWGTGWMLFGAGVAAVTTENLALGFAKASKEFSDSPFKTLGDFVRDILPSIPGFKRPE